MISLTWRKSTLAFPATRKLSPSRCSARFAASYLTLTYFSDMKTCRRAIAMAGLIVSTEAHNLSSKLSRFLLRACQQFIELGYLSCSNTQIQFDRYPTSSIQSYLGTQIPKHNPRQAKRLRAKRSFKIEGGGPAGGEGLGNSRSNSGVANLMNLYCRSHPGDLLI